MAHGPQCCLLMLAAVIPRTSQTNDIGVHASQALPEIQVTRNYFKANASPLVVISFPAIYPLGQFNSSPGRTTPQVQPVLLALS